MQELKSTMPIIQLGEYTEDDVEILQYMSSLPPKSLFKPGDLAILTEIPWHLKRRNTPLPRLWQIRFVISVAQYELLSIVMQNGGNIGMDRAVSILGAQAGIPESKYKEPVIYAHGYPHGNFPDTATWIPQRALRRMTYREATLGWEHIVSEAGARFLGYDTEAIPSRFGFELAPDDYRSGANLGHPFQHEESLTNTLCGLGLEEHLFVPIIIGRKAPRIDRDNDIFVR